VERRGLAGDQLTEPAVIVEHADLEDMASRAGAWRTSGRL
jgi:hypothetical protein